MLPDSAALDAGNAATGGSPVAARRDVAITIGGLAVLLAAIDAYVVVSIFETILSALGLPINHLERATPIVTGYLLGYVGGMPLLARVSDRYGRRLVLYAGLFGFAVGSAMTAWAPTVGWLEVGRIVQGASGGALLPVTLALAADLWSERSRARVLGGVGAAQELGSVVGPLYGVWIASQFGWRTVFWINIPLAAAAALLVHQAVPARARTVTPDGTPVPRPRVDVVGGLLAAASLGVLVVALNNQHPEISVLPPHGRLLIGISAALFAAFIGWEIVARTKLLDMSNVAKRPFLAAILTSLCAGAALLVTLFFVQLDAQSVLGKSASQAALLLARFLIALPVGAVIGGFLVRRLGNRVVSVVGLVLATGGYVLISRWPIDFVSATHHIAGLHLPVLETDLGLAGLGLGLVIAPLSDAVLRAVPEESHGIASAALVVSRMMGMLIGVAALAAWGLHKFQELTADLPTPLPFGVSDEVYAQQLAAYQAKVNGFLLIEYRSIFLIIAVVCAVGAVVALGVDGGRRVGAAVTE